MKTRHELIQTAQWDEDDSRANEAMAELRTRFDPTYGWCEDCDGLVIKSSECCLNRPEDDSVHNKVSDNEGSLFT